MLTFPLTLVLRYRLLEPGKAEVFAEDYAKWFFSGLRRVDQELQAKDWLCANCFSAADVSVEDALLLASQLDLEEYFKPAIARYWSRLRSRPAFQRVQRAQKMSLKEALAC